MGILQSKPHIGVFWQPTLFVFVVFDIVSPSSPPYPPVYPKGILKGDTCVVADGGADKSPLMLRRINGIPESRIATL